MPCTVAGSPAAEQQPLFCLARYRPDDPFGPFSYVETTDWGQAALFRAWLREETELDASWVVPIPKGSWPPQTPLSR